MTQEEIFLLRGQTKFRVGRDSRKRGKRKSTNEQITKEDLYHSFNK